MYLSFGVDRQSHQHYVALIQDAQADLLHEWFHDNPHLASTIILQEIPTLRFPAPSDGHNAAVWVYSDLHLHKVRTAPWLWGCKHQMLPPVLGTWARTIQMTVQDRPVYRCLGFSPINGKPILDLIWCTGTPANKVTIEATCVQILSMNLMCGNKRKRSPPYASQACHDDDHHHHEASDDDSPPPSPQPGPSRRRRMA